MNYIKVLLDLYRLKRNEKKSPEKMRALQDKKLRKMLHFAWQHSEFYRNAFEHAGITEAQIDSLPCPHFQQLIKQFLSSILMSWSRFQD